MPKNRAQKAQQLEALTQAVNRTGVVFFSHAGLKVKELEELRSQMRTEQSSVLVAKRIITHRHCDCPWKGGWIASNSLVLEGEQQEVAFSHQDRTLFGPHLTA